MNILSCLAVAAAAMMTLTPATAADASKKRDRKRAKKAPEQVDTVTMQQTGIAAVEPVSQSPAPVYGSDTLAGRTASELGVLIPEWYDKRMAISLDEYFDRYLSPDAPSAVAALPDSVYERRLKELVSPVQLPYNPEIKGYITRYIDGKDNLMGRIIGLSQYYFPMIEQELILAGIPVELRMLPVIESALSANAVSRVGAVGLWQFMPATGKMYGLEINSLVDERRDPIASTRAACRFLKELHDLFGDWTLAIAAYNCGPGKVNQALARAGDNSRTFWDIYDFLPRETRGYVPAFIAATYAYTYHRNHDVQPEPAPVPLAVDTLRVDRVMHFEQIASTIDCPAETIRALNPQYRLDIIPAAQRNYTLVLPQRAIPEYISRETEIFAKDSLYLKEYINPANLDKKRREVTSRTYKVKRGDTLGSIAKKHGVSVNALMRTNKIKSANMIREGQVLRIEKR